MPWKSVGNALTQIMTKIDKNTSIISSIVLLTTKIVSAPFPIFGYEYHNLKIPKRTRLSCLNLRLSF